MTQPVGVVGLAVERLMPVVPVIPRPRTLHRYALWKAVEFHYRVLGFAEGGEFSRIVTQNLIAVGRVRQTAGATNRARLSPDPRAPWR